MKRKASLGDLGQTPARDGSGGHHAHKRIRLDDSYALESSTKTNHPSTYYAQNEAVIASLISNYTYQQSSGNLGTTNDNPSTKDAAPACTHPSIPTPAELNEIRPWNTTSYGKLNQEQREISDVIRKRGDLRPITKIVGTKGMNLIKRMAISRDWLDAPFIELPLSQQSGPQPRAMRMGAGRKPNTPIPDPEDWAKAHGLIPRGRNLLQTRGYFTGSNGTSKKFLIDDIARQCNGYCISQNVLTKAETSARKDILGTEEAFRWGFRRWCFGARAFPLEGSIRPAISQPPSFTYGSWQSDSGTNQATGQALRELFARQIHAAKLERLTAQPLQEQLLAMSPTIAKPTFDANSCHPIQKSVSDIPAPGSPKYQVNFGSAPFLTHGSPVSHYTYYTNIAGSNPLDHTHSKTPVTQGKSSENGAYSQACTPDVLLQHYALVNESKEQRRRAEYTELQSRTPAAGVGSSQCHPGKKHFHDAQTLNETSSLTSQAHLFTEDDKAYPEQCGLGHQECETTFDEAAELADLGSRKGDENPAKFQGSYDTTESTCFADAFANQDENIADDHTSPETFSSYFLEQEGMFPGLFSDSLNGNIWSSDLPSKSGEDLRTGDQGAQVEINAFPWVDCNFLFEDGAENTGPFDNIT